jgi:hypothetical protein
MNDLQYYNLLLTGDNKLTILTSWVDPKFRSSYSPSLRLLKCEHTSNETDETADDKMTRHVNRYKP